MAILCTLLLSACQPPAQQPIVPDPVALPTAQAADTLDEVRVHPSPTNEQSVTPVTVTSPDTTPVESVVHLTAVGDVMLDRALGEALAAGDTEAPFADVADRLAGADISVGNLESALGDADSAHRAPKRYTFQAPSQAAHALAMAGFDVLSLANNHALDYGAEALLAGMDLLDGQGIETVGAGLNVDEARAPTYREVNGLRLAFLAYVNVAPEGGGFDTRSWSATGNSPGVAWGTPEVIRAGVVQASEQADLVIVMLHSGTEYSSGPDAAQIALSHAAIDAGAQLVIGHHAHVLQGIELYGGGVIVYGLGNFAFQNSEVWETAILNVWLDPNGVREIEILPAIIQSNGAPRMATDGEASAIFYRVYGLTELLNPPGTTDTIFRSDIRDTLN